MEFYYNRRDKCVADVIAPDVGNALKEGKEIVPSTEGITTIKLSNLLLQFYCRKNTRFGLVLNKTAQLTLDPH